MPNCFKCFCALLCLFFIAPATYAKAYKCKDSNGKIIFQFSPCFDESTKPRINPNRVIIFSKEVDRLRKNWLESYAKKNIFNIKQSLLPSVLIKNVDGNNISKLNKSDYITFLKNRWKNITDYQIELKFSETKFSQDRKISTTSFSFQESMKFYGKNSWSATDINMKLKKFNGALLITDLKFTIVE
ncbi:MAG: DUF4124 domain-containing protein [Methylococcales bacterium]|jgi:hypothetical protein|nr:DUF4124 domain-containing protein [Methylococcales bacterium]